MNRPSSNDLLALAEALNQLAHATSSGTIEPDHIKRQLAQALFPLDEFSTYNVDKTGKEQQNNLDIKAWNIAVTLFPDLTKIYERLSSLSATCADKYAADLLGSRDFQARRILARNIEAKFLDNLCQQNKELARYAEVLLDRSNWYVVRTFVNYINVLGADVEVQFIKERIRYLLAHSSTYNEDKTRKQRQDKLDYDAWDTAVTLFPDLAKNFDRLKIISVSVAEEYAAGLLSSKDFAAGNIHARNIEATFFDNLCNKNKALVEYGKLILDRSQWSAMAAFINFIEVCGSDVEIESIKEYFRVHFPDLTGFYPEAQTNLNCMIQGRVEKIRIIPLTSNKVDRLDRLKKSWVGSFYSRHVNPFPAARSLSIWVWRYVEPLYPLATRLSNIRAKRWRSLTKLSDFVKKRGAPTYKLANAASVETTVPKVFPTCDQCYLVSPHNQYEFPEIFVATINNAMTYGGTNLIIANGEVVCHDLYDFKRDYTSEELHGRTLIDPKTGRIRWLLHDEVPIPIPVAATFVDACALNYAHWMTEVLPRIVMFCAEERFQDVPIVVNDGLHKNIMESLFLVADAYREIITLPIGRALAVDKLYLTSATGYVPFERRTNKLTGHSHGMFSPLAFDILRNHLNAMVQKTDKEAWPEKIFLRRVSETRIVANMTELEKLLVDQGYVFVEPEKLPFSQQIQLFENAKEIFAPTGAALANAIFCKPGTRVIVLMAKHENMIYRYWSNMLTPMQIKVSQVLCKIVENRDLGIHGDYAINIDCINDCLCQC
jgi:capsular polysaccharide biosynthesis protein